MRNPRHAVTGAALMLMLMLIGQGVCAAATIDFTTYTNSNSWFQAGDLTITVDIDGSGNVTATNSGGINIGASGVVAGGFGESFTIRLDGTTPEGGDANVRVDGDNTGVGITGRNPSRISWHADDNAPGAETMTLDVDLGGISSGIFSFTEATFGDFAGTPTASITDFNGVVNTFGAGAATATLGGAGFELSPGTSDSIVLSNAVQASSGANEYALYTLDFDLVGLPALEVSIDRGTGEATLVNDTGSDIEIVGLSLMSDSGALDSSDWASFTDNPIDSASWIEFEASGGELAEGTLGVSTIATGETISLGAIHELGAAEDVQVEYALSSGLISTIPATYTGSAPADLLAGDFNDDGVVDSADYTVWRDNLGASVELPNETVSNGRVTQEDYETWRANFGATSALATSVPEPTAAALLGVIGCLAAARRRV